MWKMCRTGHLRNSLLVEARLWERLQIDWRKGITNAVVFIKIGERSYRRES